MTAGCSAASEESDSARVEIAMNFFVFVFFHAAIVACLTASAINSQLPKLCLEIQVEGTPRKGWSSYCLVLP